METINNELGNTTEDALKNLGSDAIAAILYT